MSAGPPIEIDARRAPPLGMPARRFLADHWQRRPLLIRGAFPDLVAPIDGHDLAGVACEEGSLARLVRHDRRRDRWRVASGPFSPADFARLPRRDWTLLVQDCDKWFEEVGALLGAFRFVPSWRIDDVMISYAVPGGSVGAHVDQYDVFLLQAHGHRRWQVSTAPDAPTAFRPDVELKLLERFEPTHEWLLGPGDMLYLPPGVPHHGVAEDECLTFSVGMRAPSLAELAIEYVEHVESRLPDELRFTDATRAPPASPSELPAAEIRRLRGALERALALDEAGFAAFAARFLSRYRSAAMPPAVPKRPFTPATLAARLARGEAIVRNPWSRYVFHRVGDGAELVFGGAGIAASLALARRLDRVEPLDAGAFADLSAADQAVVADLVNAGHLVFA
jgi:50S ribosomal protein L16 3-hydroxylase